MIISKTPLRISFIGGGTDHLLDSKTYGSVIATSIDKFIYLILNNQYKKKISISYRIKEDVENLDEIKHPIFRETLKYFNLKKGIGITSIADVSSQGTGLGSSGSFSVGLINLLAKLENKKISKLQAAELAFKIERYKCKVIGGKQDQIQAAYGGFNQIYFYENGKTKVKKLNINPTRLKKFKKNIIIFNTGIVRKSSKIQKKVIENIKLKNEFKILNIFLEDFKKELVSGNLDICGKILNETWKIKKKYSGGVTNSYIDKYYDIALKNGAIGGKILGAGGGGFLLFYCPDKDQEQLKYKIKLPTFDFNFTKDASKIIRI